MSEQEHLKLVQDCYAAFGRGDIQALLSVLTDGRVALTTGAF